MRTKAVLAAWLLLITVAWMGVAPADLGVQPLVDAQGAASGWWQLRRHAMYLTGLWSIGLMALAMLLSLRLPWLEGPLGDLPQGRAWLADKPWFHWRDAILAALSGPHPDVRARATRMEITRYGHAMSIPVPGTLAFLSQIGHQRLSGKRWQLSNGERVPLPPMPATQRLLFAHADWSGYSVFEEAFTRGHAAGLAAAG